jgi:hypothetical protein
MTQAGLGLVRFVSERKEHSEKVLFNLVLLEYSCRHLGRDPERRNRSRRVNRAKKHRQGYTKRLIATCRLLT